MRYLIFFFLNTQPFVEKLQSSVSHHQLWPSLFENIHLKCPTRKQKPLSSLWAFIEYWMKSGQIWRTFLLALEDTLLHLQNKSFHYLCTNTSIGNTVWYIIKVKLSLTLINFFTADYFIFILIFFQLFYNNICSGKAESISSNLHFLYRMS